MTSSIYNYQNEAKVWLPMTMDAHDPGNLRTLDTSGNGLHYRFGDGSTPTKYPTKLPKRGYYFDGGDYLEALANQTNSITEATWAIIAKPNFFNIDQDIISHFDASSNVRVLLYSVAASQVRFHCGDLANYASFATTDLQKNGYNFIAARRTSDGYRRLYYNGVNATPNNTGVSTPSTVVTTLPRIGARYSTVYFKGNISWFGHWEYALSELQLRDLEARLRRQLNDV